MVSKTVISEGNNKIRPPHNISRTQLYPVIPPTPLKPSYYISSGAHTSIIVYSSILLRQGAIFQCWATVSLSGSDRCSEGELTKNFQAAVSNAISGVQAPVDTMEQQAEHCQGEDMQAEEKMKNIGGGKWWRTRWAGTREDVVIIQKKKKNYRRPWGRRWRKGEKLIKGALRGWEK